MLFSYNWLQVFFDDPLPPVDKIADRLTMHSYEVDGVEKQTRDSVLSIDVLPNRAHDSFCHLGIAREISVLFDLPLKYDPLARPISQWAKSDRLIISVDDPELCPRYSAMLISGITVSSSPAWLKEFLESIGQRSINNIVDTTNFVMHSIGQPLHAFDLSKLGLSAGLAAISVRASKKGQQIEVLNGEQYTLEDGDAVIVDANTDKILALAGIKGGAYAGVSESTTEIVLESANFNPARIRSTSRRLALRSDASSRFEHGISPELAPYGLQEAANLISEIAGEDLVVVDGINDTYTKRAAERSITVSFGDLKKTLGMDISEKDAEDILTSLGFRTTVSGDTLSTKTPFYRMDIDMPEDVIEEVGRVFGYGKFNSSPLTLQRAQNINKRQYYINEARNILHKAGMSEVYTYSFTNKGDIEISKPLASDKAFLRTDLTTGLNRALELNSRHMDLLALNKVCIFEIGTVFKNEGEFVHMGLVLWQAQKGGIADVISNIRIASETSPLALAILEKFGPDFKHGVKEFDFDELISGLPEPEHYIWRGGLEPARFETISSFPYVARDVAVWVPMKTRSNTVRKIIGERAGELMVNIYLIDEFEKEGRISYCFRLIFQSAERTLTDDEINLTMWHISAALQECLDFEVR